jgi:hypothetical protein
MEAAGMKAAVEVTASATMTSAAAMSRRVGDRNRQSKSKHTGEKKMQSHNIYLCSANIARLTRLATEISTDQAKLSSA